MVALIYNSIIFKKNIVEENMSGIDVQLKKRYELIHNLVECVKEYMEYEKEILEKIVKLREQARSSDEFKKEAEINENLTEKLLILRVQFEKYPELKANKNFKNLMENLSEIEDQIAASRISYNYAVQNYNEAIERFPGNIIAKIFNFTEKEMFKFNERRNIDVNNFLK